MWGAHLADILLYHMTANKTMSTDLEQDLELFMLNHEFANITSLDPPMINNATITAADLEADNGVVHVIDKVLLPSSVMYTIMGAIYDDPDFSILVSLLNVTGLNEALSGPGPFTLFAPMNDAFAGIDNETLTYLTTTEEGLAELTYILTYHVGK